MQEAAIKADWPTARSVHSLSNNQISAAGAQALSEALKVNKTLTELEYVPLRLAVALVAAINAD